MEEILLKVAEQLPALALFVVFSVVLLRMAAQERKDRNRAEAEEREARDKKWREFLKQEAIARELICDRYIQATNTVSVTLTAQTVEFTNLKRVVTRQTATLLYVIDQINQKETNGEKMGMRELVDLLTEGT